MTDATAIQPRWTLTSNHLAMPHMPATGVSGLDLYVKADDGPMVLVGCRLSPPPSGPIPS